GKAIAGAKLFVDAGVVLTTDADGKFEIGGLTRQGHEAFVVAPGRFRQRVLFDTTAKADTLLEVAVRPGVKVAGKVTGLDGKPIAGAYVGRPTSGSYFSLCGLYESCDEAGRFEFDGLSPDWPSDLVASAPGHLMEYASNVVVPAKGKAPALNIQLRPKSGSTNDSKLLDTKKWRTVSGVVHGPDGKPAADVAIRWDCKPLHADSLQTATDKDGKFRFVVHDEVGMLAVLPRDYLVQFPAVPAGGDKTVDVKLAPGHVVRGRIRDDNGKPVAGVWVLPTIRGPNDYSFPLDETSARTNDEGKFVVKGVPDNTLFSILKTGMTAIRDIRLPLDKEEDAVWITMQHIGAVSGKVVDRDGKPIRNFRVFVEFPRERQKGDKLAGYFAGYSSVGVSFTSEDGSFVLSGVGAGSVYRLTAVAEGHGDGVVDRVKAVAVNHLEDALPATLKAGPLVALRVQTVGPDGKPLANAKIAMIKDWPQLDTNIIWGYDDRMASARGQTKADGWADFPTLSFGEATILVRAPGFARQKIAWRRGEAEFKVRLAPEAILTAEVRDAEGKPLEKHSVLIEFSTPKTAFVPATMDQIIGNADQDNKGLCRLAELPAGKAKVVFFDSNGTTIHEQAVTFQAGRTLELKIQLQKK
ncbi:MAG TPA: carboxypeptidase-like regulatory domain-containing protein, partial [Gemmataceae bacterium]|nr:carboxypeptidase-like regulatory domain-containing protein [Gemmataceae bacterium]